MPTPTAHYKPAYDKYAEENDNITAFTSLGTVNYLSVLKHSAMIIGNSSSGLLEAPSFGIPTINIGERQKEEYKHQCHKLQPKRGRNKTGN